ncbi:MAG: hypothetical protein RR140_02455 [Clostridia bacterium]
MRINEIELSDEKELEKLYFQNKFSKYEQIEKYSSIVKWIFYAIGAIGLGSMFYSFFAGLSLSFVATIPSIATAIIGGVSGLILHHVQKSTEKFLDDTYNLFDAFYELDEVRDLNKKIQERTNMVQKIVDDKREETESVFPGFGKKIKIDPVLVLQEDNSIEGFNSKKEIFDFKNAPNIYLPKKYLKVYEKEKKLQELEDKFNLEKDLEIMREADLDVEMKNNIIEQSKTIESAKDVVKTALKKGKGCNDQLKNKDEEEQNNNLNMFK